MPESLANQHPSPDMLRQFGNGELHGPTANTIQVHLETCALCGQKLRAQIQEQWNRDQPGQCGDHSTLTYAPGTSWPNESSSGDLPKHVGRYRVENEIARGGMGQVWRVTDEAFQRPLAMKVALGADPASRETQERFAREALLTGQLQHPGIPPVQEMGQLEDGRPYFIMKLVQGRDLGKHLRQRSSAGTDLPRFVAIFEQICQTLGYAHSHGIIHRDLKPGNVMVGAFGEVQVMDWGLAKVLSPAGGKTEHTQQPPLARPVVNRGAPDTPSLQTMPGTVMGTSAYMPPEQARGESDSLDARCDVFGLGGILCEILTGKPPFAEKNSIDNHRLSLTGDLSAAFARLDACGADAELVDLAKQCLAPDRAHRPAHGGAVAEAVARYQAALQERMQQAEIDRTAALVKSAEERKRRRVSLALAAALIVLIAGAGAGAFWYQGEKIREDARRESLNDKEVAPALVLGEKNLQRLLGMLANQRDLNELLSDIDKWQNALKEAQVPFRHAKAQADGRPELVESALAERLCTLETNLKAAEKDWQFGKTWDNARGLAATPRMDEYPKVFAVANLDVLNGNLDSIVGEMTKSPIRLVYLAALDDWAGVSGWNDGTVEVKLLSRLFAIANQVDTDAWRKEFRNVEIWQDGFKMNALAEKGLDVKAQSPQILMALALRLPSNDLQTEMMRKILADHPRDYWILNFLGMRTKDPVEKEGIYRAALAARSSSHVHNLLGAFLYAKNDFETAIIHFRNALDIDPNNVEAHLRLGFALSAKNDLDGAIQHYLKAVEIAPNNADAHVRLGFALSVKKDVDGAIQHHIKALAVDPKHAGAHVGLGNVELTRKDVEEAIKHFRQALDSPDYSAAAHVGLGLALRKKKDLDGAIKHFRKAIEINPNLAEAHVDLGVVLIGKKDVDGAIKHFHKAIDINPKYASAHLNLARALTAKKDVAGAIEQYRKVLDINPKEAAAHQGLGLAFYAKMDMERAIKHYLEALAINPNFGDAHFGLGRALYAKNDLAGAIQHHRAALDIDPRSADFHNGLGVALCANKDLEGAIAHYRKALDIDPKYADAYYNLGNAFAVKKDMGEAIKHLLKAIEINPQYVEAHSNIGQLHYQKKDLTRAVMYFRKALDIDPNHFSAHVNLGAVLLENMDVEGAIIHFRKALDTKPDNALAHTNLGVALGAKKDWEGAIKHHRKALDIKPDYADAHNNLGITLYAKKDMAGAIKHLQEAIRIDPNSARAHHNLGKALFAKKDLDGAIEHYRTALDLNPNDAAWHLNLGAVLYNQKNDAQGAITHFRKVLAINPNHAGAISNLGITYPAFCQSLLATDQIKDARAVTLDWLALIPAGHPQRTRAQQQLKSCDRLLALDQKLSAILKGAAPPDNDAELLALADLCRENKHYYAAATRFYAKALETEPKLAEDWQKNVPFDTARAASLTAAGKGKDADKHSDAERSKFRRQALEALRADLALWRKKSQSGDVQEVLLATQMLPHAQRDPAFSGVRDAKQLAALPKEEREPWQRLWADLTQALKETAARFIETQHQGTLTKTENERVHEMKMLAGKTYVLDLESAQFDTYLRLEDAKGKVLAENDDISPENLNSRLLFSPKEAGVYRIIATSFQQQGAGAYTLTIREFTGPLKKKDAAPMNLEAGGTK